MRTVQRSQEVIRRIAGHLVTAKKRKIMEGEKKNSAFIEKDLLSLLCMNEFWCSRWLSTDSCLEQ